MDEPKVIESRVLHRFIQPIAYYEEGGAYYNQVIGLNTQAFAVYNNVNKSGIYVVYGDGSHTYTEIRDGQSIISYCKEYPIFSDEYVALINSKADKSNTYTIAQVDALISSVYKPKGSVATYNDLPKTGNHVGDVYDVLEDSMNYVWTISEKWDPLGPLIDLTPYAKVVDLEAEENRAKDAEGTLQNNIDANARNITNIDDKYADITENLTGACAELEETKANMTTVAQLIRNTETAAKEYTDTALENYTTTEGLTELLNTTKTEIEAEIPTNTSQLTNDSDYTTNAALQEQVVALTKQINDLKLLIPQEVFDASTARNLMTKSGKVTLYEDIDLGKLNISGGIFANNDTNINLNGHTLQSGPTGGRALLLARGTAKYTFNGKGQVIDTADDSSPIWCASETSSITINDGTFIAQGHTETIYCELGTIYINGGEFKTDVDDKRYVLNCKDANYQAGTAKIIVKGGKFWDFDPHNNTAEGPNTNFCADGYTTTSEEIDGHTVYTVVKA